jgi:hypothetical protein
MTNTMSKKSILQIELYWLRKLGPFQIKIVHQNNTVVLPSAPNLTPLQSRIQHALSQPVITLQIIQQQGGEELLLTAKLQPQLPVIDFCVHNPSTRSNMLVNHQQTCNFRQLVQEWVFGWAETGENETPVAGEITGDANTNKQPLFAGNSF